MAAIMVRATCTAGIKPLVNRADLAKLPEDRVAGLLGSVVQWCNGRGVGCGMAQALTTEAGAPSHGVTSGSGNWVSFLLLFQLVYLISYIDRQILSLVVGPVKASLHLSDLQIGFLQGFGFSLVLALAALITARRVDSGNRAKTLGVCVVIWCLATIGCGLAGNFWELLAARTGLAVAEAVVPVAVLSMLSDLVPRTSIPRAGALFMMAPYLGGGVALLLGGPLLGYLAQFDGRPVPILGVFEPWRALFMLLGFPGVLLGIGLILWLPEPARGPSHDASHDSAALAPFIRRHGLFLFILMTFLSFVNATNQVIYSWTPTLMIRSFGMSPATAGVTVGPCFIIAGIFGSLLGTWWMSRGSETHVLSHVVRTMMRALAMFTIPLLLAPIAPGPLIALPLFAMSLGLMAVMMTSTMTPAQLLAPSALRGRVTALCSLYGSAAGGLGPLFVGWASDDIFRDPAKLHYAVELCLAVGLLIAWTTGPIAARMARRIDDEAAGI